MEYFIKYHVWDSHGLTYQDCEITVWSNLSVLMLWTQALTIIKVK